MSIEDFLKFIGAVASGLFHVHRLCRLLNMARKRRVGWRLWAAATTAAIWVVTAGQDLWSYLLA